MNQKPGFFQKAEHFLTGRGFYLVLILCLLVLGASGYYLYRSAANGVTANDSQPTAADAAVTVPVPSQEAVDAVTAPQDEAEALAPDPEETEPVAIDEPAEEVIAPTEEAAAPAEEEELPVVEPIPVLQWPLEGEVAAAYSSTELQYNAAMGDWRTHTGIDVAAAIGSEVCAAADGTVERVASDPIDGVTVIVTHSGGMSTSYANLDPDTLAVAAGDTVEAGQTLACVGSSAAGESTVGGPLHVSVPQGGPPGDPIAYRA